MKVLIVMASLLLLSGCATDGQAPWTSLLGPAVIEMSTFFQEGGNSVLNTSMESAAGVLDRQQP